MGDGLHVWVYILRCADGAYYVGSTKRNEPEAREREHNAGLVVGYTSRRRPVALVYAERFDKLIDGFARERQLKRWSRAKKEALIAQDWKRLADLARGRGNDAAVSRPRGSTSSP